MSRIRTVKPDLFRHEELLDAELHFKLPLRLAFIGLFTVCDREGRFRWRPRQLKLDVLPYDEVDFSVVLEALLQAGFINRYEVNGISYGYIPTWHKHQVINTREAESVIPSPDVAGIGHQIVDTAYTKSYPSKTAQSKAVSTEISLTAPMTHPQKRDDASKKSQVDVEPLNRFQSDDEYGGDSYYDVATASPVEVPSLIDLESFSQERMSSIDNYSQLPDPLQIDNEPLSTRAYGIAPFRVAFNTGGGSSGQQAQNVKRLESMTSSLCLNPLETIFQKCIPSELNTDSFTPELEVESENIHSNTFFDLNLFDMCMHVHAYACTWGKGREEERELEGEKEQKRKGEVRRGKEICATQTYPQLLSNIVAQARRRSSDPPTELSASKLRNADLTPPKLVEKKVERENQPLRDLPLGEACVKKTKARVKPTSQKTKSFGKVFNRASQSQQSGSGPPSDANAGEADSSAQTQREIVMGIFDYWKVKLGHPQAKLDPARTKMISRALALGYSESDLRDAIMGCSVTPHNLGDNDRGIRYDGLQVILRSADNIDRFIHTCRYPPRARSRGEKLTEANLSAAARWLGQSTTVGETDYARTG